MQHKETWNDEPVLSNESLDPMSRLFLRLTRKKNKKSREEEEITVLVFKMD